MDIDRERIVGSFRKKAIEVKWFGRRCAFELPVTGFSSFGIDLGTARLLRGIDAARPKWGRILDLGCGYGPIAAHLVVAGIAETAMGIDRDRIAVEFARRNALKNDLPRCSFAGGLAYQDVPPGPYSAIVSNVPAKAGESVHRMILLGASALLEPSGEVWIVVVSPLESQVDGILGIDQVRILDKKSYNGHVVYRYAFNERVTFNERKTGPVNPFFRKRSAFEWRGTSYAIDAFMGLPEFDTLSYETALLLRGVADWPDRHRARKVAVCNPGQGHLPVLLPALCRGMREMVLVGRDALALEASAHNARESAAGLSIRKVHAVSYWEEDMGSDVDVFLGSVVPKEGVEVSALKIAQACLANPRAVFLAACSASLRHRVAERLRAAGIRSENLAESRGNCVVSCRAASRAPSA